MACIAFAYALSRSDGEGQASSTGQGSRPRRFCRSSKRREMRSVFTSLLTSFDKGEPCVQVWRR